ncbi:hypothetical protein CR513_50672, partial [Mucuna pruriens]
MEMQQKFGVDYKEVFAPIARHDTVRLIIAHAAQNSWSIFQLDVKSAFLHGDLEEQHKVYRLKKALYGLKQAPRAWYSRLETYFLKEGFQKCPYEHTFFTKISNGRKILIVCVYVNDLIFTGNDAAMFDKFKKSMMIEFDMTNLGMLHYFLGMLHYFLGIEVMQSAIGIFISQKKYMLEILDRFQMKICNSVSTPTEVGLKLVRDSEGRKVDNTLYKQIVGSLMYLTAIRSDITHVIHGMSKRDTSSSNKKNLLILARDCWLWKREKTNLIGFTYSDYIGDQDDRKSTSGYIFMIGSGAVSCSSKKQPIVTLSTTEVEFVVATSCAYQVIWVRKILEELCFEQQGPTSIYCDSSSTIKLSKNLVLHGRSKHINVKYHFLRNLQMMESLK